jgi:hypothetical protein
MIMRLAMEMFRYIQSEGKPVRWLSLGESSPMLKVEVAKVEIAKYLREVGKR